MDKALQRLQIIAKSKIEVEEDEEFSGDCSYDYDDEYFDGDYEDDFEEE